MGNYNPLYKKRSSKQLKLNISDICEESVIIVSCSKCEAVLTQRGCSIRLASDLKTRGYSTDTPPEALVEAKEAEKCKQCNCFITKANCKQCGTFCAIHSLYLCQFCSKEPTNGHKWLFIANISGEKTQIKWNQLQPRQIVKIPFKQLLEAIGVSNEGLQILAKQKIESVEQLHQLDNDLLKGAGLCLGDISKLRQLK